jgi:hypothetical protein
MKPTRRAVELPPSDSFDVVGFGCGGLFVTQAFWSQKQRWNESIPKQTFRPKFSYPITASAYTQRQKETRGKNNHTIVQEKTLNYRVTIDIIDCWN